MTNSPLWLSQTQFCLSLGFLGLFLLTQMGLAWVLVYFKLRGRGGSQLRYVTAYRFWVRVFALAVIMVMAAAVPVLLQFGSLWPGLMSKIGNVASPLLAITLLTVFVFKSCFLGPMLFGQRRMSESAHTLMVVLVAVGTTLSVMWILMLLGWLQRPAGTALTNGVYQVTDWNEIFFNPVFAGFLALALVLALLIAGLLLMGVTARQSLHHVIDEADRTVFRAGLVLSAAGSLLLLVLLAVYGAQVATYQPAKAAATAAYWVSGEPPDLPLFVLPHADQPGNSVSFALPGLAQPFLGIDDEGVTMGLDKFDGMHAPVGLTFWSWRLLVLLATAVFFLSWMTLLFLLGREFEPLALSQRWRRGLSLFQYAGWFLLGLLVVHVWFGQLPWVVYGDITVTDVAADHDADTLFASLLGHVVVFVSLMAGFIQLVNHSVRYGVVPVARRRGRA